MTRDVLIAAIESVLILRLLKGAPDEAVGKIEFRNGIDLLRGIDNGAMFAVGRSVLERIVCELKGNET